MSKIYIVYGNTGEYSDRREWTVAAYADEAMAREHAELAMRWYQENDAFEQSRKESDWQQKNPNPYDPYMSIDYTGTDWTVGEVELRTELPPLSPRP